MGFFNFVKKIVRKYKNMNFVLDNQEIDNKSVEETGKKQEIEKETIDILVTNDIENCVCTTETSEIAEEENDCDGNSVEIGYEIPGNKFIKVYNTNRIYRKKKYIVGEDITPGEYYLWGRNVVAKVIGKSKKELYEGFQNCRDVYVNLVEKDEIILESGCMTCIDNIIYTYRNSDEIVPRHVYRVGIEIPHGNYKFKYKKKYDFGEEIFNLDVGECAFNRHEDCSGRYFRKKAKEGVVTVDEMVKYITIRNGCALLEEEGLFIDSTGPEFFRRSLEVREYRKKKEVERKERINKYNELYDENNVYFYFSVIDPVAELVLSTFFSDKELELLTNLSEEDFAKNYKAGVDKKDSEKQLLIMSLFLLHKIDIPRIYNCSIFGILDWYGNINSSSGFYVKKAFNDITKYISKNISEIENYYEAIYPECVLYNIRYFENYAPLFNEEKPLYCMLNNVSAGTLYNKYVLDLAERGLISKKWRNEFDLYLMTKSYYPDAKYQYHDKILDKQSLDIFIPSINMGLEYQGIQHYQAVEFFGGEEGLEERKKLDASKREKCKQNGILLVEWEYTKDITDSNFVQMLREHDLSIPEKIVIKQEYLKEIENEEAVNDNKEVLFQYSLSGVFVSEFASIDDAVEKTGINKINIQRACIGFRDTAGGYQWRKVPVETLHTNIEPVVQRKSAGGKRAINQYDMEGNFIKRYESLTAASTENAINSKSIRDAANNKQRHAGGFVWKYEDED